MKNIHLRLSDEQYTKLMKIANKEERKPQYYLRKYIDSL